MADLLARFRLVDEMSSALGRMAESGQGMVEQWEAAGEATNAAFDGIAGAVTAATSTVDGVAVSIESLQGAADGAASSADTLAGALGGYGDAAAEAVAQTDYWTEAVGNYDRGALEAVYTTEELVEMGFKSAEALEQAGNAAENLAAANSRASSASEELSRATENAAEEAENGGKKGLDAIESIAGALAAAGITAKIQEIAEAAYELATAFSEAEKIVVNATGATGEALEGLERSMLQAYSGNDDALNDVAGAIGEINTRMGLTGDALTDVTGKFLDFADITGQNVVGSVQNVTKLMNKWNVDAADLEATMDKLAYAGQISGASVDGLSSTLITGAASFQEMGLSLDNAISMLAQFELYGMNGTTAITALRTAVKNFSDDGLDASTALQEVISEIANMESAADATALAVDTFGSRAGVDMANAIRSGAVTVDTLTGSLEQAIGTLDKTAAAGESLEEKWQKASNNIGAAFTTAIQPTVDGISSALAGLANGVGTFLNKHPVVTKAITALGVGLAVVATGIAGVTFVTTVAIPAVTAFGVALNTALGPVGWVALAITGVVAAGTALIAMMSGAKDETASMTATTRAQYYELQNLNSEYEQACEKYGETSEEASRLKYQVDDLSEAFEANRQTLEEFVTEVDTLCESVSQVATDFEGAMSEIDAQETGTLALIQKYEDLATQTELTGAQQKELEAVTKKLSETFPELSQNIDLATVSAKDYVAAMRDALGKEAEERRQQEAQETYVEALQKRAELTEELAKAEENLRLSQQSDDNAAFLSDAWFYNQTGWLGTWATQTDEYTEALEKLNEANAENEATIAKIEKEWENLAAAEQAAAEETISWEDAAATAFENVKDRVIELCEAYGEAYNAALESFEGQFGLFDEASMKSEEYKNSTVENAQKALDSQLAYWEAYQSNIEVLKGTSAADLGITQENYEALVSFAQDGSEQAAGLAQSMAKAIQSGDTEAVAALANTVGKVNEKQEEIAAATADWITDFSTQMDEIEKEMQSTVEGMKLDTEAASSATATINAYADAIRAGKAGAVTAAEEVADAVTAAFSTAKTNVSVKVASTSSVPGHANGTTNAESLFLAGERGPELVARSAAAYANGTTDSTDYFIAGENGPELIAGEQGSTVFPTEETDRLISALNDRRQPLQVFADTGAAEGGGGSRTEQEKRILLEIAGSGAIEVGGGGGANKETILEVLYDHLKPVLMNLIQGEIYEEGDYSYEY